jgi:tRNA pseudouridine13 synthase
MQRSDHQVDESSKGWRPSHQTSSSQEVKQLSEEDLPNYTIHDIIMPLPGWNIDYPAGDIGELYTKILHADGLDPKRMQRDQRYVSSTPFLLLLPPFLPGSYPTLMYREYSLPGSYRKIIHLPSTFTWSHVSYTDPDISLVQSDEDKILNLNPPAEDDPEGTSPNFIQSSESYTKSLGKFQALKIELTLGPSAYATMALREITREETSTWHHIGLTMKGEDQEFKGTSGAEGGEGASGEAEVKDEE